MALITSLSRVASLLNTENGVSELRTVEKYYSGKRLLAEEADAVVAELRRYLMELADRWLFKGRFHTDLAAGVLPMEAIKVFWQNWYGFVDVIGEMFLQFRLAFEERQMALVGHAMKIINFGDGAKS